ncbi:MAG: ribonuclease Z [Chloroflexi bacterium]|nr:MAG: ribonuclease Z [Chloroflexota bacterium]TMD66342.1 MAG: ribonuclease Z [Chloroflexota bacterium]
MGALYCAPVSVTSVEITFLGTGAAFSPDAYNASILVDGIILLDAGAPLTVHLPRAGVSLDAPRCVLLSHFHADHTFGLAALMLGRALHNEQTPPLTVYGPVGTTAYIRQLLDLAWGEDMRRLSWERLHLTVQELTGGTAFEADGSRATAFTMQHSRRMNCLGFTVERDGVRLGYTGDAEMSPQLEALVSASDHVITEMTYDAKPGEMHLSRREVEGLMERHQSTRFIITHRGSDAPVSGAVMARDFLTLHLPLR